MLSNFWHMSAYAHNKCVKFTTSGCWIAFPLHFKSTVYAGRYNSRRVKMKQIIILILIISSAFVSANPIPEFPFVILTERLEKQIPPDLVKIRFSLTTYASTSKESLELLRVAGKSVITLLENHKIPLTLLESNQIDKSAKRARKEGTYNLDILGYETTQNFKLNLNDLKKYPTLMNKLIAIDGVTGIQSFFKSSQEEKFKEEMINELSVKARQKADTLAKAQSRKVKEVYGLTTEGNFGDAYAIFSLQFEPRVYAMRSAGSYGMDLTMMVPEYIVVNQRITVIYELEK